MKSERRTQRAEKKTEIRRQNAEVGTERAEGMEGTEVEAVKPEAVPEVEAVAAVGPEAEMEVAARPEVEGALGEGAEVGAVTPAEVGEGQQDAPEVSAEALAEATPPNPEPATRNSQPTIDNSEPATRHSQLLEQQLEALRLRYLERLRADPAVVPELVEGNTVEEIEQSFVRAQEAYRRIAERLNSQAAASGRASFGGNSQFYPPVPSGAGERRSFGPDLGNLNPVDKIAYGLGLRDRS